MQFPNNLLKKVHKVYDAILPIHFVELRSLRFANGNIIAHAGFFGIADSNFNYRSHCRYPVRKPLKSNRLLDHEYKIYTQHGEDGVLQGIFNKIGTTNKYYVEVGTEDGSECNTRLLREHYGWKGIMFDSSYENATIGLYKAFIYKETVNELLASHGVP